MSFDRMMNSAVDIVRTTRVADGSGGWTTTTATIASAVPCRFNALSTREMILAYDKQTVFANFTLFMGYRTDVAEGDALVKCDDSRTFEVRLKMAWDEARNYLKLAVLERARAAK